MALPCNLTVFKFRENFPISLITSDKPKGVPNALNNAHAIKIHFGLVVFMCELFFPLLFNSMKLTAQNEYPDLTTWSSTDLLYDFSVAIAIILFSFEPVTKLSFFFMCIRNLEWISDTHCPTTFLFY